MNSDQEAASSAPTTPSGSAAERSCCGGSSGLRMGRLMLIAVPLGLLIGAALLAFAFFDLGTWLQNAMRPALVPARVRVMYRGEVLKEAQLATAPAARGLRGAIGFPTEDGDIVLKTDIDGAYQEGAYTGEHRVTVQVTQPVNRPGPPPLLTPEKYAAASTTPLRIFIYQSKPGELVVFELEGDPPASEGQSAADRP